MAMIIASLFATSSANEESVSSNCMCLTATTTIHFYENGQTVESIASEEDDMGFWLFSRSEGEQYQMCTGVQTPDGPKTVFTPNCF